MIYQALVRVSNDVRDSLNDSTIKFENKVAEFKNNIRLAGYEVVLFTGSNDEFIKPGFSTSLELFKYEEHIGFSLTQEEKNIENSFADLHLLDGLLNRLKLTQEKIEKILENSEELEAFANKISEDVSDENKAYEIVRKNI